MPKKNARSKRADAERAAEHYAHEVHHCIVTCRAIRTKWQRQDLFGGDVIGKRADGTLVVIQVTAGQSSAVTARRRKLEVIPWQDNDTVELLQLVQTEDPANARRKLWFFRVHVLINGWHTLDKAVPVPRKWFRAWKENGDL